jgi:hypothetical protein
MPRFRICAASRRPSSAASASEIDIVRGAKSAASSALPDRGTVDFRGRAKSPMMHNINNSPPNRGRTGAAGGARREGPQRLAQPGAPDIKILRRDAEKIAPRAKDPLLSPRPNRARRSLPAALAELLCRENRQSPRERTEEKTLGARRTFFSLAPQNFDSWRARRCGCSSGASRRPLPSGLLSVISSRPLLTCMPTRDG